MNPEKQFKTAISSILTHDRMDRAIDPFTAGSYDRSSRIYVSDKYKKRHFTKAERNVFHSDRGAGALSRFPQNLGRLLVESYCPNPGLVYDPFAGHNSRMQLVFECGRDYVGVDVSAEFMAHNRTARDILLENARVSLLSVTVPNITLIEGSSSHVDVQSESADFTITSPPYWNIEYYGDEPEQLGNAKTYERFLELISAHVSENARILKHDSFCCWCINDFKKSGKYHAYHADLIPIFLKNNFDLFDIYVFDLGWPLGAIRVQNIVRRREFPKCHEYCLVFRKVSNETR